MECDCFVALEALGRLHVSCRWPREGQQRQQCRRPYRHRGPRAYSFTFHLKHGSFDRISVPPVPTGTGRNDRPIKERGR